jgi:putative selenate reductase molybdopterin-binding subunit
MVDELKYVGRAVKKVDARKLATGRAAFADDVKMRGMLHARLLYSPYAHARIREIDTSQAERVPGVRAVLTYKNVPRVIFSSAGENYPEPPPYDQVMFDSKVRFVGDRVAAVAADSLEAAESALALIRVEYEQLDPVFDVEFACQPGAPVIHDESDATGIYDARRNVAAHLDLLAGDPEQGFRNADLVMEREYRTQFVQHCALEPHVTICYLDEDERLIIRTSTQVPFHVRRIVAHELQLPVARVRVIKPRIGGGFGGKQEVVTEDVCAALCLATRRPVRLEFTRQEEFVAARSRHPQMIQLKMGIRRDGQLTAVEMHVLANAGAYGTHSLTVMGVTATKTFSLYNVAHAKFTGDAVYTNLPVTGAFRGYGAPQGFFAFESMLDELAAELGVDRIDIRRKNFIRAGQVPPFAQIISEGKETARRAIVTCGMEECLQRGMEEIDWNDARPRPHTGSLRTGFGVACAMQSSGIARLDMGSTFIKMNEDGSFNLLAGVPDIGTGSDTIMAQIAAEVLSVDPEKIIVCSSDTDVTPFDSGAYASSTTFISGTSVLKAAEEVRRQILSVAADVLECDTDQLMCQNGAVYDPSGGSVSYSDICHRALYEKDQFQIMATASHFSPSSPPPFAAAFAEVEVDVETGVVRVKKVVSAVDCGFAINPQTAEGQVEGAVAQAIGFALTEDMPHDGEGRMLWMDFRSYKILAAGDMPEIVPILVTTKDPAGPFGAKSIAEIPISSPAAAIANAVADATGVRIRQLPLTPERVFRALKAAAHLAEETAEASAR